MRYKLINSAVAFSACTLSSAILLRNKKNQEQKPGIDHVESTCTESGTRNDGFQHKICEARNMVLNLMRSTGAPGITVAVSVDGETVWCEGFGYADIENQVPCTTHTVMKLASLSKPLTMTIASRLIESGKLDIDKDICAYVPEWPKKTWDKSKVKITTRMLASHMAGIRDYKKIKCKENNHSSDSHSEFDFEEYYITYKYKSVKQSLEIFKQDDLIGEPGSSFQYSTHGYTLLSAVLEGASREKFPTLVKQLFTDLGMGSSYLDLQDKIAYNRARYYTISETGSLNTIKNAPFTECSFKLAGAGMLSTAQDMVRFGNVMLYSQQCRQCQIAGEGYTTNSGYLKSETVSMLWTPVKGTKVSWNQNGVYGMGWQIVPYYYNPTVNKDDDINKVANKDLRNIRYAHGHTGGTIGASSAFLILPSHHEVNTSYNFTEDTSGQNNLQHKHNIRVKGIVVAVLCNLQGISMGPFALDLIKVFNQKYLSCQDKL